MEGGDRRSSPPKGEKGGGGKHRSGGHHGRKDRHKLVAGETSRDGVEVELGGRTAGLNRELGGFQPSVDGELGGASVAKGSGALSGRVYSKSPVKRASNSGEVFQFGEQGHSDVANPRGGLAPISSTVRSLLAKFGSESGGELAKSSWAATMEALDEQESGSSGLRDSVAKQVSADCVMPNDVNGGRIVSGGEENNVVDMCCESLEVVGNTQDSIMHELGNSVHHLTDARLNAQPLSGMPPGLRFEDLPMGDVASTPMVDAYVNQGVNGGGSESIGMADIQGQNSTVHRLQGV